jgi:hypothetical protein
LRTASAQRPTMSDRIAKRLAHLANGVGSAADDEIHAGARAQLLSCPWALTQDATAGARRLREPDAPDRAARAADFLARFRQRPPDHVRNLAAGRPLWSGRRRRRWRRWRGRRRRWWWWRRRRRRRGLRRRAAGREVAAHHALVRIALIRRRPGRERHRPRLVTGSYDRRLALAGGTAHGSAVEMEVVVGREVVDLERVDALRQRLPIELIPGRIFQVNLVVGADRPRQHRVGRRPLRREKDCRRASDRGEKDSGDVHLIRSYEQLDPADCRNVRAAA